MDLFTKKMFLSLTNCYPFQQLIIVKKWGSLNATERREIQKTLWNHYGSLTQNVPKMQREKIAHLIALIGKREFPDDGSYKCAFRHGQPQ